MEGKRKCSILNISVIPELYGIIIHKDYAITFLTRYCLLDTKVCSLPSSF